LIFVKDNKRMLRDALRPARRWLNPLLERLQIASINAAAHEQGIDSLSQQLASIVPDLTNQYTTFKVKSEYLRIKVRTQHAFQISMALRAFNFMKDRRSFFIVDVGDSSGTHTKYLNAILSNDQNFGPRKIEFLSINIDPAAVNRIRSKGLNALLCNAEDLYKKHLIRADLFLSFQMLEHLYDPISFLNGVSKRSVCDCFVLSVPYLARSRVGLYHIRQKQLKDVYPENTHIFELSPEDWKLIFQHSGWRVVDEMVYRQYPSNSILRFMKPFWRYIDFEGFYGTVLMRDRGWANCYK